MQREILLLHDETWIGRSSTSTNSDTVSNFFPSRKIRRLLLLVVFLTTAFFILRYASLHSIDLLRPPQTHVLNGSKSFERYLVNTPMCKIPYVDPYDSSVRHIVSKTGARKCPEDLGVTYQVGHELRINWTLARRLKNGKMKYCTYTPLYRPQFTPTSNDYFVYLEETEPFIISVHIKDEFIRVNCYNNLEHVVYTNFHAFIQRNSSMDLTYQQRLVKHVRTHKITDKLNVLMVGMDSVSRLSFGRQMVKTKAFLEDTLGAFDMSGYNKVADNTFINIVPMTMGKFVPEMPWDESKSNLPFDNFTFAWDHFSKNGYRTFYAEDAPDIAIFDFLKAGFQTPPTDHYNRPMCLAMEIKSELWSNNHHCFQNRLETDIVLGYMHDFLETYKNEPHFAFTFITRLSHDDVNSAGAADEPYYNFFKSLYDEDLLENTVVFFYSDHGMRFGKIRETFIGKLEERLPFMYVVPPKWLLVKYPHLQTNLRTNSHRLTSPFDVYETLLEILYFDGKQKAVDSRSRGVSWFREIPNTRSCDQAGILPHWCTCLQHKNINLQDDVVLKASYSLLSEVMFQLKPFLDICETLSLHYIREASRLVESDDVLRFIAKNNPSQSKKNVFGELTKPFEDIQLTIETVPGNALFEGTVRLNTVTNAFVVVGDISRINIYGHQSECIEVFRLKKFCQCKGL